MLLLPRSVTVNKAHKESQQPYQVSVSSSAPVTPAPVVSVSEVKHGITLSSLTLIGSSLLLFQTYQSPWEPSACPVPPTPFHIRHEQELQPFPSHPDSALEPNPSLPWAARQCQSAVCSPKASEGTWTQNPQTMTPDLSRLQRRMILGCPPLFSC